MTDHTAQTPRRLEVGFVFEWTFVFISFFSLFLFFSHPRPLFRVFDCPHNEFIDEKGVK